MYIIKYGILEYIWKKKRKKIIEEKKILRVFEYKDIPTDLGNLADSTKIFMVMNTAGVDCYQGSIQCKNQRKLRLILAVRKEDVANLCVIWHILLLRLV